MDAKGIASTVRAVGRLLAAAVPVVMLSVSISSVSATPGVPEDERTQPSGNTEESVTDPATQVVELRRLLEELKNRNADQIRRLQDRIAELEERLRAYEANRGDEDELAGILAEAEELTAEEAEKDRDAETKRETFVGRQRTLQAMNPEISFLGDFSYDRATGPIKDGFLVRGVELSFQAPLDPYTRFKAFLAGHQEPFGLTLFEEETEQPLTRQAEEESGHEHGGGEVQLGVEEAYMEWVALPTNLRLYVGKFRQQYGTLNRWHPHALPSAEMPFALQRLFGHDGLVGLGVGLSWQLPRLWASSNSLTLEVTNADNPHAFAGAHWSDPAILLRHTGFFDLGPDAYFEIGLNGLRAPNDESGDLATTISGVDFNFVWEPVERAHYRGVELRGEWIHSRFEAGESETVGSDSYYAYLTYKLNRRWSVGLRHDNAEVPFDRFELLDTSTMEPLVFVEGLRETAWTPFVTWWQSEFVRLRLQYQHACRDFLAPWGGDDEDRLWFQVTFAAGPHKHEAY